MGCSLNSDECKVNCDVGIYRINFKDLPLATSRLYVTEADKIQTTCFSERQQVFICIYILKNAPVYQNIPIKCKPKRQLYL